MWLEKGAGGGRLHLALLLVTAKVPGGVCSEQNGSLRVKTLTRGWDNRASFYCAVFRGVGRLGPGAGGKPGSIRRPREAMERPPRPLRGTNPQKFVY